MYVLLEKSRSLNINNLIKLITLQLILESGPIDPVGRQRVNKLLTIIGMEHYRNKYGSRRVMCFLKPEDDRILFFNFNSGCM